MVESDAVAEEPVATPSVLEGAHGNEEENVAVRLRRLESRQLRMLPPAEAPNTKASKIRVRVEVRGVPHGVDFHGQLIKQQFKGF